ncbi:MAG TPA: 4Fe-4S dicluster domain-containing protein, partial [Coriobacteriia bacterium]|nr:4Fe-4S dicluster domain-containing protein [Coriobacteriia bacterium]
VGERLGSLLRLPRLRLTADSSACTSCGSCSRNCPMQLPVQEMVAAESMRTTECFMCETCVDVCPSKAIGVGFGKPGKTFREK